MLCVQVASSEWVLGVNIQHFENMFNAEIRSGNYCCCDDGVTPCGETIDAVKPMTCTTVCHPYFVVHFQACPSIKTCYVAKTINITVVDPTSVISSFLVQIPFSQSELETYSQVRLCSSIMNKSL